MQITGTFNVDLTPADSDQNFGDHAQFGRMTLSKTFHGDLNGTSAGEMLSCRLPDAGSAGYVALEQFTGTVNGQSGSFVMQHYGVMSAQGQHLTLEILPGSGTDKLTGISGSVQIDIKDGTHHYTLDYELG
ncbi:DUF3224 domain-containing protein [Reinekea blandensis]|uniref:DUF3224 domain-containing protein n=1 Tax=Reinekea blandensis MED297 TaxID=314283 RepID=A4B9G2_9GAMM|nr:DUF3224 domain-containing protein [Reinekea blandensis]EAR11263.1 hypothetical protein MED297_20287 [Reinekea sp. MED297] [Reinekea blandensis MED297]